MLGASGQAATVAPVTVAGAHYTVEITADGMVTAARPGVGASGDVLVTPGFLDLQVNGFAGVDFNSPGLTAGDLDHALEAMLLTGVTGCLPTLITAPLDELEERFRALVAAVTRSRYGARMVAGFHLEGPFLSPLEGYSGCHLLAESEYLCVECRAAQKGLADDGEEDFDCFMHAGEGIRR